jgi:ADP-heptose:LPS heptosyltransferase
MTHQATVTAPKSLNPLSRQAWLYGWYKIQGYRYQAADRVNAKAGWIARQIRWPLGVGRPDGWPELHVLRVGGIGDTLMCTPALRLLKQMRPEIRIVFYPREPFVEAVRGLPFLDEVRPHVEFPRALALWWKDGRIRVGYKEIALGYRLRAVELLYEGSGRPRRHIARIHGDQLGLDVQDIRPSCVFNEARISQYQETWALLPRPWIVVNRRASSHTPNKEWPGLYWDRLIDNLLDRFTVIEIGVGRDEGDPPRHPHYVNLTGMLPLDHFLAVVAASDIHVGPDSGPAHVAAAAGKPAVVIFGGYVHPDTFGYEANINLYTELECSPCWLIGPCPYNRLCLSKISPQRVEEAIEALVRVGSWRARSAVEQVASRSADRPADPAAPQQA